MGIAQFIPQFESSNAQFDADYLETVGQLDDFDGAIGTVSSVTNATTLTPTITIEEDDQSDISGWSQIFVRVDGVFGKTPDLAIDFTGFRNGGTPPTDWRPVFRYVDDTAPVDGRPRDWQTIGSSNSSPFTFDSALTGDSIEVCIRPRWRYIDTRYAVEYLAGTSYAVELPSSVAASALDAHIIAEQTTTNNRNSTPTTVLNQYAIGFDDVSSQPAGGLDKLNFVHVIGQHATEDAGRYGGWDFVFYYAEATGTDADWLRQHVRLFVYDGNPTGIFTGRERFDSDDSGANNPNRAWDDSDSPTINEIKSAITADVSRVDLLFDWHSYGDWGLGGDAPSATVGGFSSSGTTFTNWITRIEAVSGEQFSLLGTTATAGTAATYGDGTLGAQLSVTPEFAGAKGTGYPDQFSQFAFLTDNISPALKAMVDNSELTLSGGGSTLVVQSLSHAHSADNIALTQAHSLVVQELDHSHTTDGITLSVSGSLEVQDASHGHTADNIDLTQNYVLTVEGLDHSHDLEAVILAVAGALGVNSLDHAHSLDNVALTQAHILAVDGISHAHILDALSVTPGFVLSVNDINHLHEVEGVTLTASGDVLTVNGMAHIHGLDNLNLTQANILSVEGLTHAHLLDVITLGGIAIGELNGELYLYASIDGDIVMKPILTATIH